MHDPLMHYGRKSKTLHKSAELRKKTFSMQYRFLETRLKKEDLFNDADIGDGRGEKREEKLGM